jgi:hypothetical protein
MLFVFIAIGIKTLKKKDVTDWKLNFCVWYYNWDIYIVLIITFIGTVYPSFDY